jgi:hypothetical protein
MTSSYINTIISGAAFLLALHPAVVCVLVFMLGALVMAAILKGDDE